MSEVADQEHPEDAADRDALSELSPAARRFALGLNRLRRECSVTTYLVAFRDPDSDIHVSRQRGEWCWRLGAARALQMEIESECTE